MVDIRDRRTTQRDFHDGTNQFAMPEGDPGKLDAWSGMPTTRATKRAVHGHYSGLKQTQTWQEASRLASRRTRRSGGPEANTTTTANYAHAYQANLVDVLTKKGPQLAKRYGEVTPGR